MIYDTTADKVLTYALDSLNNIQFLKCMYCQLLRNMKIEYLSYNLRKIREMCWKESIFYLASSLYRSKSVGFNILNEGC